MTALLAAARAIHFLSLMAIFGGGSYALLLRRAGLLEIPIKATRGLFATAATLAVLSGLIWFCLIAGQMSGSWQGSLDTTIIKMAATGTRFGHIFLVRSIGLAALWFLCALPAKSPGRTAPILAGLLLASLGPVSHAAAAGSDISSGGGINDAVHLLAAGFWLGGLVVLALFLQQHWSNRASLLGSLRLFSIWGTPAVAVLVITGLINAVTILPLSEMSLDNNYFDLLLVKVGLASVMVLLATLNRWHFAPALKTGGERATQRLAASVGSEILLGVTIVAIAGLLGLTPPVSAM